MLSKHGYPETPLHLLLPPNRSSSTPGKHLKIADNNHEIIHYFVHSCDFGTMLKLPDRLSDLNMIISTL
jgi:hypothetical protein